MVGNVALAVIAKRVKNARDLRRLCERDLQLAAGALRLADDKKRALQQRLQAARNSGVFRGKPDLLMGKRRGMEQRAVGFRARTAGALHGDTAELVFHLGRKGHIRSPFFVLSFVICGNRGAW